MQYNTIQNMFIFITHATYTMKPNTMQLMQHNTQKATHAMPHMKRNPCHLYHLCSCMGVWVYSCMGEYVYKCIAIHRCMGAMDA